MIRLFPKQTLRTRSQMRHDALECRSYLEPLAPFADQATLAEMAATFGFDVMVIR